MFDVLHVTPSLDPTHGGPSRTVPALAAAQAALGARVALACAGPAPTDFATRYPGVALHTFPLATGPTGSVFRFSPGLARWLRSDAATTATVHAHGVWLRPLHYAHLAASRQNVPLVLAPRGMLEPWARTHHAWRKRLAALLIHPGALSAVRAWHATSEQEAEHLRALHPAPVVVAPNGIDPPPPEAAARSRAAWLNAHPRLGGRRVALFYGRFHQKKRVAELIDLWRSRPRPGWTLLVAGLEGELTLAALCARAALGDPAASVVVADGSTLPPPYALAELFLLPSHSENFGQTVVEALAAAVPALVTDTLPWRGLIEHGAGEAVPWEDYGDALARHIAKSSAENNHAGLAGRAWVLRDFTWEAPARQLLAFYPARRFDPKN